METNISIDEKTGLELLYRNKSIDNLSFSSDIIEKFNSAADELSIDKINRFVESKEFNMPQVYKEIDVPSFIRNLLPAGMDKRYIDRVEEELVLFETRNLFPILQLLIYIVSTMRKNKIVWGVGRGSSVASYCLYLIGVHRIDSVKYNLDIHEFLK